jgi:hypothetical protein
MTHYPPRTQAFERLSIDGGWLTAAQLAMECHQSERSVDRSLHRQTKAGWLVKRIVYLAGADAPGGYNNRDQPRRNQTLNRRVEFRVAE